MSVAGGKSMQQRGTLIRDGKVLYVHRYAYSQLVEPLKRSHNLKRTCEVSECCNPMHARIANRSDDVREKGRIAQRQYRNASDPLARRVRRSTLLKSMYGITIDDYEAMIAKQNNRCAICSHEFEIGGDSRKRPCVDHCHKSGDVRGILCSNCNTGIGYFSEDPAVLKAASDYTQLFTQREISFRTKKPQAVTCLKCGTQGHNSRTCKQQAQAA